MTAAEGQAPFTLPLSALEFARALEQGLGRAMLHVRAFRLGSAHVGALLDACAHYRGYDPSSELFDRGPWVAGLVTEQELGAQALDLLEALAGDEAGEDDLQHRATALRSMTRSGSMRAMRLLRQMAGDHPDVDGEVEAAVPEPASDGRNRRMNPTSAGSSDLATPVRSA